MWYDAKDGVGCGRGRKKTKEKAVANVDFEKVVGRGGERYAKPDQNKRTSRYMSRGREIEGGATLRL